MASEKITAIIDSVKELSVLELKELIDAYCEEFGVSAVAAAAPAAAGAAAAAEEEKTEFHPEAAWLPCCFLDSANHGQPKTDKHAY